jgi:hypothetical protein
MNENAAHTLTYVYPAGVATSRDLLLQLVKPINHSRNRDENPPANDLQLPSQAHVRVAHTVHKGATAGQQQLHYVENLLEVRGQLQHEQAAGLFLHQGRPVCGIR